MKPCEIHYLLGQASTAREQFPNGIHTFALYWITWEAYRTRMLAIAVRLCGWSIDDAYCAIGAKGISNQSTYRGCFKKITGIELAEQRGMLGRVWKNLDDIEALRHRLIHGYRGANPLLIGNAIDFLDIVLTNHEQIFGKLTIVLEGRQIQLGNVLAQRPATGRSIRIRRERQELIQCLQPKRQLSKLPDSDVIKRLQRVVEELDPSDLRN